MKRVLNQIRKFLQCALVWCVALNLFVASIPRCDTIFAALHKALIPQDSMLSEHCAKMVKTEAAAIGTHRVCECNLAKLVFGQVSKVAHHPVATHSPQAISVLIFSYSFFASHPVLSLDTPPPRFA